VIGRRKRKARARVTGGSDVATDATTTAGATAAIERPRRGAPAPVAPQREVSRFGHGSRVPGWDDAVDLTRNPAEIPDPATTPVPAKLRAEIEAHMAKYPDFHSAAIPALAAAQRVHGWCSPEAIWQAACVMRLTPGYLISVASFYDMLETRPVGRHAVYVCTNISCSLCGADELLARIEQEVEGDPDFNVRHFECLGACDIAPMASVDGIYVGPIELDEVPRLIEQIRDGTPPLPGKQLHLRKSTDPGAARADIPGPAEGAARPAIAGAADPISPTGAAGPPMGGGPVGPPAAIERPATEDDDA
jgi:NADH-quinone oxidoreductase subunit E